MVRRLHLEVRVAEGFLGDVDVDRYCANRYGEGARAGLRDRAKPRSWYCQR